MVVVMAQTLAQSIMSLYGLDGLLGKGRFPDRLWCWRYLSHGLDQGLFTGRDEMVARAAVAMMEEDE